ncbi:MAG TPA: polysaccharide deacetylase family protein [Bacteroidales bacterium]|nr:polysaccharide deacetylase family protein [Bacteroidales bacterium]
MKLHRSTFLAVILSIGLTATPQGGKNLADRLGYPHDAKLLLIHADDMGLSHSVNTAVIKAFDCGGITSGSIMVPCPWAREIEKYVKDHPTLDVGIHLTMTAEWENYKWGGISPSDQIPSLLDREGDFYATVEDLGKVAKGEEARKELKAQIEKAIAAGVHPTHLDTHMGSVLANPALVKVYLELSAEYGLPVLFPRAYVAMLPPDVGKTFGNSVFLLDNLFMIDRSMIRGNWIDPYKAAIENLKPGLNQIIVHLGTDNDEMKAICSGHDDYGSAWRQKDLDMVTSKEFSDLLKKNKVVLVTWKQIRDVMKDPDQK